MPTKIFRDEVARLMGEGAQIVEVLPQAQYEWEHLPDAVNIPLKQIELRAPAELDRHRPVVVYCNDFL